MRAIIRDNSGLIAALGCGVALKAFLLALDVLPFNADEAIVALMARHILGGERPIFFYGQAYLGSLDAWLIAAAFWLLGEGVRAIRVVQIALYLGTIITTYLLARQLLTDRRAAVAAAWLMAVPTVLLTLYSTSTLGGYGETLLIGNVLLLWCYRLIDRRPGAGEWLLFGALAGLGFWGFALLGVYLLPVAICLWLAAFGRLASEAAPANRPAKAVRSLFIAAVGFMLGSYPWWQATLSGGLATVSELGGSHIAGVNDNGALGDFLLRLFNLIILGIPVIIGLRPSWEVRWLALPLAPLAIAAFLAAVGRAAWLSRTHWRWRLILGVAITLLMAFVLTPFGFDPSGRYFLPLATPLALFTAELLQRIRQERPRMAWAVLGGVLAFNLWGNLDSALRYPPGITTQFDAVAQVDQRDMPALISFLRAYGELRGYTNYWVSFPLAFLSDEQLIYTAALPYHLDFSYTTRDDRYVPYRQLVSASDRVAYITTHHPPLNDYLRRQFAARGVKYSETQIGDFTVFYDLSRHVPPTEMGLGVTTAGR